MVKRDMTMVRIQSEFLVAFLRFSSLLTWFESKGFLIAMSSFSCSYDNDISVKTILVIFHKKKLSTSKEGFIAASFTIG